MPADSATRSAAMTGASLALVALGAATQVTLYLRDFGATHRTDGFIAAFAVYSLVVVFGQLLRTTAVPLLSGSAPKIAGLTFSWAIVLIAVVAAGACEALAAPLGHLISTASGPEGRRVAIASLRVMAPAIGLQLVGAGLAIGGALRDRLVRVAFAYMASSVAGLAAFFLLRGQAHERVLAWTMLSASVVLVAGLLAGAGIQPRRPPAPNAVLRGAAALLGSTSLPASFVLMYPITIALAPAARPGQVTLFGLAFTTCSFLAGFTGQALSMVDAIALTRIGARALEERRVIVTRAFRYSVLIAVPGLGVAAVAGGPIVRGLISGGSAASHQYFGIDLLLLAPWLVATLALWATLPALLAQASRPAKGGLTAAVIGLIGLHVLATLAGRAIAGFDGVIVAMSVAPVVFVAASLHLAVPAAGRELLRHALIIVAVGAASFGVFDLGARAIANAGAVSGMAAAIAGALAYGGIAAAAYPDAARTIFRLAGRRGDPILRGRPRS